MSTDHRGLRIPGDALSQQGSTLPRTHGDDRGAAALELAFLLPVLILLVTGVIELGRMYQAQIELQHAASVGAREYALTGDAAASETAALSAATGIDTAQVTFSASACVPRQPATVTLEYPFQAIIPFFPAPAITLTADGSMQCIGASP